MFGDSCKAAIARAIPLSSDGRCVLRVGSDPSRDGMPVTEACSQLIVRKSAFRDPLGHPTRSCIASNVVGEARIQVAGDERRPGSEQCSRLERCRFQAPE
jgi:hypothetical protein